MGRLSRRLGSCSPGRARSLLGAVVGLAFAGVALVLAAVLVVLVVRSEHRVTVLAVLAMLYLLLGLAAAWMLRGLD